MYGFEVFDLKIVVDIFLELEFFLKSGLEKVDVFVLFGGVLMGEKDFLKFVL